MLNLVDNVVNLHPAQYICSLQSNMFYIPQFWTYIESSFYCMDLHFGKKLLCSALSQFEILEPHVCIAVIARLKRSVHTSL